MPDVEQIRATRHPASFEGISFVVETVERSGRNHTADIPTAGRGTRTILTLGPDKQTWRVQGWLIRDEGPDADKEALINAMALGAEYERTGVYVCPFDGALDVVPVEWSIGRSALDLDSARLSLTFAQATLPIAAPVPGFLADSPLTFAEVFVGQAASLADEPLPAAQLEAMRDGLGLANGPAGANYAQAAAGRLLQDANLAAERVPALIQRYGRASRTAALGEYSRGAWAQLRADTTEEAARSNSPTLWVFRATMGAYLSALGVNAFGITAERPGRSLLSLGGGGDIDRLARRNRTAVAEWFVRGVVRL